MGNTRARSSYSELVARRREHVLNVRCLSVAKKGYDRMTVPAMAAAYGTATGSVYNCSDSSSFGS